MQWELVDFRLSDRPGPVKVFTYEVNLKGHSDVPQLSYRGDGILSGSGQVRLNREAELRHLLDGSGVNAQQLIEHLAVLVRTRAEKLMLRRMAAPVPPAGAPAPSPASALAHMWRYM